MEGRRERNQVEKKFLRIFYINLKASWEAFLILEVIDVGGER